MSERVDVVIVGAGPAGMTAALYASRANLKTVLIESGIPGGEMNNTADIENYPGFATIPGPELSDHFFKSATAFGARHVTAEVQQIEMEGLDKIVVTTQGTFIAPVVIVATGATHRTLDVPGEDEFAGRGVSYCAVCDGFFFRDKDIVVVGGGDSAIEEGLFLTQFARSVTIIHRRDQLRAQPILQERAFQNEKIKFIWDTEVTAIHGENLVEAVELKNLKTDETTTLPASGVFIYVGMVPNSDVVKTFAITDDQGWIVTDDAMQTAVPGLFAIGDVRAKHLRQISTAVGDGGIAGQRAYDYLQTVSS